MSMALRSYQAAHRLTQMDGRTRVMIKLGMVMFRAKLRRTQRYVLGWNLPDDIAACPCSRYVVELVAVTKHRIHRL